MSSSTILNGAPMVIGLGIQDNSAAVPAIQPEQLPTHLPKVYLYAQKGPLGPQLVSDVGAVQMYGVDTFDLRKGFATHQTVLSNLVNAAGNAQMIERMVPTDMGPKANFLLSLDLLTSATVPQYQRNADGTYVLNATTGLPVPVTGGGSTLAGYIGKWVVTRVTAGGPAVADSTSFGAALSVTGDQPTVTPTSTRYPIMEFWASSYGSYGNNAGFRISAPNTNTSNSVNTQLLSAAKAYPFRLQAISRINSTSTPTIVPMLTGDQFLDFVLKPGQINPATNGQVSLADTFPKAWQSLNQPGFQNQYADLGNIKLYQNNIDTVLGLLYAAEKSHTGSGSDFTSGATDETYKFNFISAQSSTGAPYYTFQLNTADTNAVSLTENTNIFAGGGFDGTMNETLFAGLVTTAVSQYANLNSPLNDGTVNVESIIYDSGFPLATKQALCNFISQRKDTFVVLSTYDVNGAAMTASDEAAIATALRAQLQLFPESSYFGTPVVRGMVIGRYGDLIGSQYTKKLPITLELAAKSAAMMGAGTGIWKKEYLFDKAPLSVITMFANLNTSFVPGQQRNVDWANGLNYPISFTRDTYFLPAIKTAYSDDTSVLTNYFTAMACVELEKIGHRVWREFSGAISLTDTQLIEKVNNSVNNRVNGKFAGLFKIVPAAYVSGGDATRGYSYTLPIKIFANNSKNVMTLSVQANRMSAYVPATP